MNTHSAAQALADAMPFYLWAPIDPDVEKGGGIAPGKTAGIIKGIVSSELVDADGEVVDQSGLDWSLFKSTGKLVLEHPANTFNGCGEPLPEGIRQFQKGGLTQTELTARLWLEDPVGQMVWQKSVAMHKSGATRRLGFSIEGRVLPGGREGNRVMKAQVTNVAICASPKNPITYWEPVMASMAAAMGQTGFGGDMIANLYRGTAGYPVHGVPSSGPFAPLIAGMTPATRTAPPKGPKTMENQPFDVTPGGSKKLDQEYFSLLGGIDKTDLVAIKLMQRMPSLTYEKAVKHARIAQRNATTNGLGYTA